MLDTLTLALQQDGLIDPGMYRERKCMTEYERDQSDRIETASVSSSLGLPTIST